MANNLKVGSNIGIAKANISFTDAGITGVNTLSVFRIDGAVVSYVPGRLINAITAFELGKGYFLKMLTVADFTSFLTAPGDVEADPDIVMSNFNGVASTAPVAETGAFTTTTNWEVDGSGGVINNDTPIGHALFWNGAANSRIELTIKTIITDDGSSLGVIVRANDNTFTTSRLYYIYHRRLTAGEFMILSKVGGVETTILAATVVRALVNGDVIVCETDGTNANISFLGETVYSAAHGNPNGGTLSCIYTSDAYVFDKLVDH